MAIFDKIGEFAKSASGKAEDKIEIIRLNGKIKTEQQTIQSLKADLGARYWDKISSGALEADPGVSDLIDKINASLANIAGIEEEIRKIEEERAAAEAAAKAAAEAKANPAPVAPPPVQQYAAPVYEQPPAQQYAVPFVEQPPAQPAEAPAGGLDSGPAVQGEYNFGAPVVQPQPVPPVQPVQPVQPAQSAPAAEGPRCVNCAAALVPGAKFCPECGAPAPVPAPMKRFCQNCGHEIKGEARFCPECGTKV